MGELGAYLTDGDPLVRRMKAQTSALVQVHARMGTRPRWDVGPLRLVRILGKNHKPVVHGVTRGRRYAAGAYCPLQLDPPPQEIVSARFEYFVWRAALERITTLAESWKDASFAPQQSTAPWRPWLTGEEREPVIHTIAPSVKMTKLPLKPQRPLTEPQVSWPLAGPVRSIPEDRSC
jgi:hypothetical protein